MAHEVTIPLLPCRTLDELLPFYVSLGFEVQTRQSRPNPYVALRRDDIQLHFFGMDGLEPEQSYGSCIVVVPDADALYRSFTEGLRKDRGRVPLSGIPRLTRPRKKQNSVYGFSVVDPGGNWIRIYQQRGAVGRQAPAEPLAKALETAIVLGESKGDPLAAAQLLDRTLSRHPDASLPELVRARVYRAELALALARPEEAAALLLQVHGTVLTDEEREEVRTELERARELEGDVVR